MATGHGAGARAGAPPTARALALPGGPKLWERLGFAPGAAIGDVRTTAGAAELALAIEELRAGRPDGLALFVTEARPVAHAQHPNGAIAIDHVVALTGDMDRTLAALRDAGLEVRRERRPPEAPARQAFVNLGTLILEVVQTGVPEPALWGVVVVVEDLDALGPLVGAPRDAVQPGRRIATVRSEAGLPVALAFMTPRPQRSRSS